MAKKVHREPPMMKFFQFIFSHYLTLLLTLLINSSSPPPHFLHLLTLSRSLYISINLCRLSFSTLVRNMMNQNVIGSDRKLILGSKTITVSVSNSPMFSSPPTYFTFPRRKFLELLEAADKNSTNINKNNLGAGKIASWVDSMRDSSPTRIRSSSHDSSDNDHKTSWTVR